MAQTLKKSVPGLMAAHLATFTTVSAAPELHVSQSRARASQYRAEVFYPQWWRNPAIVLRGWRPRVIERRGSWYERIGAAVSAALEQVREWRERARSRGALLRLDEHALRDIGISRATAEYLGARPFWRPDI